MEASSTAAVSAAMSRILFLRAGSNPPDVRRLAVPGAGVPGTRPGSEDQEQARGARGPDLMALLGHPVRERARACLRGLPSLLELDLAGCYDQVGVLVDLVLLEQ